MRLKILISTTILLIIVTTGILLLNLYEFVKTDTILITPAVKAKAGEPVDLEIKFNKYDRVYLILDANTTISEIHIQPKNTLISLPLDVEGVEYDIAYPIILQRGFFYVANSSGSARITLTLQPQIPYAIKTAEGEVNTSILAHENLTLRLEVKKFATNNYSQLLLVQPYDKKAEADFQVGGTIKLVEGKIAYVNLILMTKESAWYAFRVAPGTLKEGETIGFNINARSTELFGRNGEFLGKEILFIVFGIGFYRGQWSAGEMPSATIILGDLFISNNGESCLIKAQALKEYELKPRIYIFRKFTPTHVHTLLVFALASEIAALTHLALRWLKLDEKDKASTDHHRRV